MVRHWHMKRVGFQRETYVRFVQCPIFFFFLFGLFELCGGKGGCYGDFVLVLEREVKENAS